MIEIDKILPKDGYCIVGVCNFDLYIDKENNIVFGIADPRARKGVLSFMRYKGEDQKFLKRCCRVLFHEICHIFGLRHCAYYQCNMNGINQLEEVYLFI